MITVVSFDHFCSLNFILIPFLLISNFSITLVFINFAKNNNLSYESDDIGNVIIRKDGRGANALSEPILLQGQLQPVQVFHHPPHHPMKNRFAITEHHYIIHVPDNILQAQFFLQPMIKVGQIEIRKVL